MNIVSCFFFVLLMGLAFGRAEAENHKQHYPNVPLEVVFENDRVLVQKGVLQPGQWEGIHSHSGNQLGVNLTAGQVTVRQGGDESVYIGQMGSVEWQPAVDLSEKHESGNTGNKPYEFLWVNLKQPASAKALAKSDYTQHYPNIPSKDSFENDRVLVQRFVLQPGKWEGIHEHSGNQLFIMLTDGLATVRFGDEETTANYPAGLVGWQPAVELSEMHESGNVGEKPLEILILNLKN